MRRRRSMGRRFPWKTAFKFSRTAEEGGYERFAVGTRTQSPRFRGVPSRGFLESEARRFGGTHRAAERRDGGSGFHARFRHSFVRRRCRECARHPKGSGRTEAPPGRERCFHYFIPRVQRLDAGLVEESDRLDFALSTAAVRRQERAALECITVNGGRESRTLVAAHSA